MSYLQLRYLARLREALGTAEEVLEVPADGLDLLEVMEALGRRHGPAALAALNAEGVRLARNQELVERPGLKLLAGDELAFLPPVTGG